MSKIDECFSTMGALVFSFQSLEKQFLELLGSKIEDSTPHLADILINKLSFGNLLSICIAVCRDDGDPKFVARMESLVTKAAPYEQERNKYLHSHYNIKSSRKEHVRYHRSKHRIDRKRGFVPNVDIYNPKKLRALIRQINDTKMEVWLLHDDMMMKEHPDLYTKAELSSKGKKSRLK